MVVGTVLTVFVIFVEHLLKNVFFSYFAMTLGYQDKSLALNKIGYVCVKDRNRSKNGKKTSIFAVFMIWRELRNHFEFCYICSVVYNPKNKK